MRTYILHQVNCQGAFGAGFAGQIAKYFPEAKDHYKKNWRNHKLGDYLITDISEQFAIVHLFGQEFYGNSKVTGTKYTNERALEYAIREFLKANPGQKYICPKYIGCGLAGGDWNWIEQMLNYYGVTYSDNINLSILKKEKPKTKKNKFTEYAIIDHVGSVDQSILERVYKKAFGMIENGLTAYTMKKFCLTINPNVKNLDSMKNSMRMSKNPKQIVLIVGADNMNSPYSQKNTPIGTSTSQWISKEWLERCNNVTILQVIEDRIYEYSAEDIDPTLFKLFEPTNSIERQYAAIWGPALEYHFSAPLYKDDFYAMKEEYLKRAGYAPESGSYSCKRTTRPEKYRVTKQIASEKEVKKFYYDYYLYLKERGILEEFLSPDYKICPHCGNPVNINAPECTCHHKNPYYVGLEFSSYYDTEELDDEIDYLDDFEEEEIFDIDEF